MAIAPATNTAGGSGSTNGAGHGVGLPTGSVSGSIPIYNTGTVYGIASGGTTAGTTYTIVGNCTYTTTATNATWTWGNGTTYTFTFSPPRPPVKVPRSWDGEVYGDLELEE